MEHRVKNTQSHLKHSFCQHDKKLFPFKFLKYATKINFWNVFVLKISQLLCQYNKETTTATLSLMTTRETWGSLSGLDEYSSLLIGWRSLSLGSGFRRFEASQCLYLRQAWSDEGTAMFRNVANESPKNTVSHLGRLKCSRFVPSQLHPFQVTPLHLRAAKHDRFYTSLGLEIKKNKVQFFETYVWFHDLHESRYLPELQKASWSQKSSQCLEHSPLSDTTALVRHYKHTVTVIASQQTDWRHPQFFLHKFNGVVGRGETGVVAGRAKGSLGPKGKVKLYHCW